MDEYLHNFTSIQESSLLMNSQGTVRDNTVPFLRNLKLELRIAPSI
jgi:hypothetical protein